MVANVRVTTKTAQMRITSNLSRNECRERRHRDVVKHIAVNDVDVCTDTKFPLSVLRLHTSSTYLHIHTCCCYYYDDYFYVLSFDSLAFDTSY